MPPDERNVERRERDDAIAAEPELAPIDLPSKEPGIPLESQVPQAVRLVAISGVVENGLVRLLDPSIGLPENTPVIVVASQNS